MQMGILKRTVTLWLEQGYLHRLLPRVYAVGHAASSTEADLAAALLYAGPGAMLSHSTAAWWRGLLDERPRQIHVSTPRQCRSQPGIPSTSDGRSTAPGTKGLPMTSLPQALLDLAAGQPLRTVRRALAKADYAGILDVRAVEAILGNGRPGAARLRTALERHQPRLALTKSDLEISSLEICEKARHPSARVNAPRRRLGGRRALARTASLRSSSTATATITLRPRSSATGARSWRSVPPAICPSATPMSS